MKDIQKNYIKRNQEYVVFLSHKLDIIRNKYLILHDTTIIKELCHFLKELRTEFFHLDLKFVVS